MTHFEHLDLLLNKRFNEVTNKNEEYNVSTPFYLAPIDIKKELNSSIIFDLSKLDFLVEKLQLSDFEKDVLLILFAVEIDPKYEKIYAYLQDDMNKRYPTVHFIADILTSDILNRKEILHYFISESKLSLLKLLESKQVRNNQSSFYDSLNLSRTLTSFLLDSFLLDEKIDDFCKLDISEIKKEIEDTKLLKTLRKTIKEEQCYLFNICGNSKKENILSAKEIAQDFGFNLLYISSSNIPLNLNINELVQILLRDALLSNSFLFFDDFESFLENYKEDEKILLQNLEKLSWMSFFSTSEIWNPEKFSGELNFVTIENNSSSELELVDLWTRALKGIDKHLGKELVSTLAQHFKFTAEKIDDVSKLLKSKKILGVIIDDKEVLKTCRLGIEKNLKEYAQHLSSENRLKDIILCDEAKEQMKEIVSHYKHQFTVFEKWNFKKHYQSRGLGVLFSGSSGTGKTMAATILANEIGLELYRIELSKIVSKYIGETEKNLAKIFEIAEQSGVVLFFDEADAIFGKRSQTQDSHDRYANIEVSYLLQKIEEYDGLVILASNFKNNIDDAFMRRMRFIIDFPLPDEPQREVIWKNIFSNETDTLKIDFNFLAKKFKLSGANIRNSALYAAFDAVEKEKKLDIDSILNGIKRELYKIGKPLKEEDLEKYKKELIENDSVKIG